MLEKLRRRHRGVVFAGALVGALGVVTAMALPAGATPISNTLNTSTGTANSTYNSIIVGSGSSTTYFMMQGLDTLFNDAPGCYLTAPSGTTQPEDFSCFTYPASVNSSVGGYTENPTNDASVQEPPLGSSVGIAQLENQGAQATNTGTVNYARSSRALKSSDDRGLNFIAYARDGLSFGHFSATPSIPSTPSSCVVDIPTTGTEGLDNLFGDVGGIDEVTNNTTGGWYGVTTWLKANDPEDSGITPGNGCGWTNGVNQPVMLYSAQNGSGTESTWTTDINANAYTVVSDDNSANFDDEKNTDYANTHVIFENETKQIIANAGATCTNTNPTAADCTASAIGGWDTDPADALFYFSLGKMKAFCHAVDYGAVSAAPCGGAGFTWETGNINDITPSVSDILCDNSVETECSSPWPVPRYLYNVYSDGNTSPYVEFSPATEPSTPTTTIKITEENAASGTSTITIDDGDGNGPVTTAPIAWNAKASAVAAAINTASGDDGTDGFGVVTTGSLAPSGSFPGAVTLNFASAPLTYSDSTSSLVGGFPEASAATLNYVSEIGFICKPQTYTYQKLIGRTEHTYTGNILDVNTGSAYRVPGTAANDYVPTGEISAVITKNGFIPLPLQAQEDPTGTYTSASTLLAGYAAQTTVPTPNSGDASTTETNPAVLYEQADPDYPNYNQTPAQAAITNAADTNPSGYCLAYTTDGN